MHIAFPTPRHYCDPGRAFLGCCFSFFFVVVVAVVKFLIILPFSLLLAVS